MKSFGKKAWLLPQPVLIIGTYDENGNPNAMNAAWGGQWDNHKIMISMGKHQTSDNLNLKGEFTVAFATVETMVAVFNGTKKLLDYARTNEIQSVLLASSLEVYGTITNDSKPLTEEAQGFLNPMDVRSSYPMAKRAAETLCHNYAKEYGTHTKVARLAQTFGAGVTKNDNRVFAQFARSIINGEDIIMHTKGELCRCYCYTTDAIAAMLYILLRGKDGEAYNVANETTYISIKDMATFLAETFNPKVKVVVELKENMGYSPTTKLRLSTNKIQQLGWTPHYNLQEMFHRLIESLKQ